MLLLLLLYVGYEGFPIYPLEVIEQPLLAHKTIIYVASPKPPRQPLVRTIIKYINKQYIRNLQLLCM